jgi:putative transposase
MGRVLRSSLPDGYFHVTARSVAEAPLFRDDSDRILFLIHLGRAIRRFGLRLETWCLMTTHHHAVVEGPTEQLSRAMQWLHGHYAREHNARHRRYGALFAERFSSRVIEDEQHLTAAIEYVLDNPVRAGLVERWRDWPWSGSTRPRPEKRTLVRRLCHG